MAEEQPPIVLSYATPARRLSRAAKLAWTNVGLMGLVAGCFFLPLMKLTCGPVVVNFNGYELATGTVPDLGMGGMGGAMPPTGAGGMWGGGDMPVDWGVAALLVLPLAAMVGFIVVARKRSDGAARWSAILPAALIGVYAFYLGAGFSAERQIRHGIEQAKAQWRAVSTMPSGSPLAMGMDPEQLMNVSKTVWFLGGMVGSAASVVLVVMRERVRTMGEESPRRGPTAYNNPARPM
jgi:hypothetical protein